MKKVLVLLLTFVLISGLSSCAKKEYELPWDHFCYSASDGSVIELSPEEKGYIIDLLNNGKWYGEIAKCTSDVKFATQRQSIGYCISEGIFNDFTQNKSLRLSDKERNIIKGYLVKPATKLIEIEKYTSLTTDGTLSIEVVYDYIKGEFATYEFDIYNLETIEEIMTEVFNMELKDYPEDQDIDFYQRWITVNQGDSEYLINLAYASDKYGNRYLCQSRAICEIIEKYIEDNIIISDIVEKETTVEGIDNATKIEVARYDIGKEVGTVTVTDEASIKHIVDNLNSLKLKELKYNEPTAIEYELTFYNAEGEIIKTISIELGGWVDHHGSLHSVVSGELDIAYIAGLFE